MTLKDTRRFIFQQMVALKEGRISIDEALTQSKLATRIIESYNTEIKAVELAASIGDPLGTYTDVLNTIETTIEPTQEE